MRFKATTWILITALVGIAAYFFLFEEKDRIAKEKAHAEGKKLFPYESKDIQRFVLVNPRGERIEAEREDSLWKVVSPVEYPGDAPTIDAFIGQVVPGRKGEELAAVANMADYGLEKPFATLIVYRRGAAAPDTLYVGDKTPTSSNSYVRLGNSPSVFISSEITHNVMNKNLFHLRDKNFLTFGSESIGALTIQTPQERMEIEREGRYWWFATRRVRADRTKIEPYLTRLTRAIIYEFVRENLDELAAYGLKKPSRELTLTRGAETMRISFGTKKADKVHVARTGLDTVVLLENGLLEAFDWTTAGLRAMNLSFFDEDSVQTVRYETPDTSLVLRKSSGKWRAEGADTLSIKSYEVSALLRKLSLTTFERISKEPLPEGERALAKAVLTVTLENAGGAVIDRITMAKSAKDAETGASISANAMGALAKDAFNDIHAIFKRIGER